MHHFLVTKEDLDISLILHIRSIRVCANILFLRSVSACYILDCPPLVKDHFKIQFQEDSMFFNQNRNRMSPVCATKKEQKFVFQFFSMLTTFEQAYLIRRSDIVIMIIMIVKTELLFEWHNTEHACMHGPYWSGFGHYNALN